MADGNDFLAYEDVVALLLFSMLSSLSESDDVDKSSDEDKLLIIVGFVAIVDGEN